MTRRDKIHSFSLVKHGLARVLGSLEAEVMEIIWQKNREITIREVWEEIRTIRPIAFNTVMTVMNRLTDKGLLQREPGREAHRFRAVQTKEQFLGNISRQVAEGLIRDFGKQAIAPFVEALEKVDPSYLRALEEYVQRQKDAGKGDKSTV